MNTHHIYTHEAGNGDSILSNSGWATNWMIWYANPRRGKGFFSYSKCLDQVWDLPSHLLISTGFLLWGQGGQGVQLTTHVKNEGAIHLLSLYAVMARTRTTFSLYI